jgi:hypothetical protein
MLLELIAMSGELLGCGLGFEDDFAMSGEPLGFGCETPPSWGALGVPG